MSSLIIGFKPPKPIKKKTLLRPVPERDEDSFISESDDIQRDGRRISIDTDSILEQAEKKASNVTLR